MHGFDRAHEDLWDPALEYSFEMDEDLGPAVP
jgi:hypothetical protein